MFFSLKRKMFAVLLILSVLAMPLSAQEDKELTDTQLHAVMGIITNFILSSSPGRQLKKTGQTTVYYTGDDGSYQAGVTPNYTRDDASEVVTDHITGLEWQDDAEAKTITKNWADAQTYCSALGLDGGGWRLPTIQELQSIVVYGEFNPSIDTTAFVNCASYYYWSSTTNAGNTSRAWIVGFSHGDTRYSNKSNSYNVRCVR